MKLHIVSDIHEDHNRGVVGAFDLPDDVEADAVVIAGDIDGRFSRAGMRWIERQRGRIHMPFIVVAGNHCHWRGSLDREVGRFAERFQQQYGATPEDYGIFVLDGDAVITQGIRFVGGTLWTDYAVWGGEREHAARAAVSMMVDHRYIRQTDYAYRLRPKHLAAEHERHRDAIERILSTPFDGPSVVVTHHAPSPRSLVGGRAIEPLDGAYASDLEPLIRRLRPDLWVHGHTHERRDYVVGETRIVCNPRGYARRVGHGRNTRIVPEHKGFDPRLIVEVGVGPRPVEEVRPTVEPVVREPVLTPEMELLMRDWPTDYVAPDEPDESEIDLGSGWKP